MIITHPRWATRRTSNRGPCRIHRISPDYPRTRLHRHPRSITGKTRRTWSLRSCPRTVAPGTVKRVQPLFTRPVRKPFPGLFIISRRSPNPVNSWTSSAGGNRSRAGWFISNTPNASRTSNKRFVSSAVLLSSCGFLLFHTQRLVTWNC